MSIVSNPQANFTPPLKGYTGQGAFRFWCQTVLPLVYDDSLSYYELLNKVVQYLNNTISDVSNLEYNVQGLYDAYVSLQNYVNGYFSTLDVQEEINNKLDEMARDGTLSTILASISSCRVNVKSFIAGELTSENIGAAISAALSVSDYIYIPAGDYKFSITIANRNCDILCSSEAIFRHGGANSDNKSVFIFNNCSVKIHGGQFTSDISTESRSIVGTEHDAIIELYECNNCLIENIKGYNSKMGSIVNIEDSENVIVQLCDFNGFIVSAIHILYSCKNVKVTHCNFKNAYIKTGSYYCYFVLTGVYNIGESRVAQPPENLEYSYNYCENSEDCGLDTHGARNVRICNNTVLNTATAITAYNDSGRVNRPDGWIMSGVVIENNYCESNVNNTAHNIGFIFIFHSVNNGKIDIENVSIRNNTFIKKNGNTYILPLVCCRNVELVNNTIIGNADTTQLFWGQHCENIIFENNTLSGGSYCNARFDHCYGAFNNNIGDNTNLVYYEGVNSYNYMRGAQQYSTNYIQRMLTQGETYSYSGRRKLVISYGLRCRESAYSIDDNTCVVANGIVTTTNNNRFIPNQVITFNNGYVCRVGSLLDINSFTLGFGDVPPDGNYTVKALEATTYDITNPNIAINVDNTVSADTLTDVGTYYCNGKMADTPIDENTELTQLTVIKVSSSITRQTVFGTTSSEFWVRVITATFTGAWYHYTSE